ncbi:hypothetical protein SAMN05518669_1453 [Variovorax sp. YR634]|nr:hypothetical protein SAMN05518669_1453 [Variovorax sp. YR634]SOD28530.1 hypothetical protein SAMN05518800_4111 [Variovorax sp. YR752]
MDTTLVNALREQLQRETGQPVALVETHISWVLLTQKQAFKLKKPVRLPFLDFGSVEARKHFCEEELRLNRRFAPSLYIDVAPVCGTPESPSIAGTGTSAHAAIPGFVVAAQSAGGRPAAARAARRLRAAAGGPSRGRGASDAGVRLRQSRLWRGPARLPGLRDAADHAAGGGRPPDDHARLVGLGKIQRCLATAVCRGRCPRAVGRGAQAPVWPRSAGAIRRPRARHLQRAGNPADFRKAARLRPRCAAGGLSGDRGRGLPARRRATQLRSFGNRAPRAFHDPGLPRSPGHVAPPRGRARRGRHGCLGSQPRDPAAGRACADRERLVQPDDRTRTRPRIQRALHAHRERRSGAH